MSMSLHIKGQAEYYSSKGCMNQKNEIVASPSQIPMYKGKTEEQILYEYLKEKRGSSQPSADRILSQSSIPERERSSGFLSKGFPDRSVSNHEGPKESVSEQKGLQSRNLAQSAQIESRRSDALDDDLSNKKVQKEIEKPKVNEDSKPKNPSSLQQRLKEKRKGQMDSAAQKPNAEIKIESVPRDDPQPSRLRESMKVDLEEDSKGHEEIPKKKVSEVMSAANEEQVRKQVPEKGFDMMNATFRSAATSVEENYADEKYFEEPISLMNQVTGPLKPCVPEKKVAEEQRELKSNKGPELAGLTVINFQRQHVEEKGSLQNNNRTSESFQQERDMRNSNRGSDSPGSQPTFGYQKLNMTGQDDDRLSQGSSNLRDSGIRKPLIESEPQGRREESEYIAMSRVSETKSGNEEHPMKQSQVSGNFRQREVEELDFDEAEREPLVRHHDDQMRESRSSMKPSEEEELRRSEYMNEERNRKPKDYIIKKNSPGTLNKRREQEPESANPTKSESSFTESNERKVQKSEKGEVRSVASYAKNTEKLVTLLLAKIEKMEENQEQMMQIMRRQEQKIRELQSSLGIGDDEELE